MHASLRLRAVPQSCATFAATLLGLCAWGLPAVAQTQTAVDGVQQIVVTAQKRVELLKDVPTAVSAYGGGQLEALGINNATDLRFISPSITFSQSANVRGEGFQVRGVGTAIFSDAVEQSVGFVVDGVVLARSGQASGDLLDVDRVEVLRGPQGMLFGKNASAGLVSVTTKRPRLDQTTFEGRLSYANPLNEVKSQLVGNLPLGSTAALRLAYGSTKAGGYVRNINRNENLNNRDEQLFKAKLLWIPADGLDVYLIADSGRKRTLCCAWTARSAPVGTTFATLNAAAGIVPGPGNETVAAGAPFFQNSDTSGLSGEVNYDLGWATLTSLTAAREWKSIDNNDPDLVPNNILDRNSGSSELRQNTQELRLTSPGAQTVEWVAGLYWFDQKNVSRSDQAGTLGAGANILGTVLDTTTKNTSSALFGQAGWKLGGGFKLIGGARYTKEKVALDFLQSRSPTAVASIPGRYVGAIVGEVEKSNISWRVTGQFDVSPEHMVYATAARGFKGPGINTLGVSSNTLEVIQPEIPTTVELGARSSLMGGMLNVSGALFKTKFDQFQAQVFDQNVTPGRFRVTNAGRLDTQGLELEATARPTRDLTLSASAAYIDAKYGDFKNIACYTGQPILPFGTPRTSDRDCIRTSATGTAVTNGTGNPLTASPKFSYNLSARQGFAFAGFKAFAQANWAWRDTASYSAAGDPNLVGDAYGLLGASVGVGAPNGSWQLSLWGKNLGDKRFTSNLISQPVLNAPGVYSQFTSPDARRTVGLTLNVKLGG